MDGLGVRALLLRARFRHWLVEPPRAPDLASQRERPPELDTDDGSSLCAPASLQHHAQDAVDAEPGVLEAGVVHVALIRPCNWLPSRIQPFCFTFSQHLVGPLSPLCSGLVDLLR